jgi:hypothetical protein
MHYPRYSVLLLALVLLYTWGLAMAPSVRAQPFNEAAEQDYQAAIQIWGRGEPTGCLSVSKELVSQTSLTGPDAPAGALGRATQPLGGFQVDCVILIAEDLYPCETLAVMTHEVGHLLGFSHADFESIYPYASLFAAIEACDRANPSPIDPSVKALADRRWHRRLLVSLRHIQAHCREESGTRRRVCWERARVVRKEVRSSSA